MVAALGLAGFVAFAAAGMVTMWKLGPVLERWSIEQYGEGQE